MKVKEYHDNIENKAIVGRINKDKQYANKHVIKKIKTSQFAIVLALENIVEFG